ncbi:MAG: XRE family transcriptional regulator [Syntrophales bacterium]|nr:XRE family transcriptional regulator [Syntrophales bacterium]
MGHSDVPDDPSVPLRLGEKLRGIREGAQLTIHDLAAKTGLPKTVLEEIEGGEVVPPVATLLKLAKALGVGMAQFFEDGMGTGKISVTRRGERIRIRRRPHHHEGEVDYIYEALETHKPDKHMEPLFVEFQPMETVDMVFSSHDGEEFVYLLEGKLEFRTDDRLEVLEPGDALYFESDINHAFRGLDGRPARAVVVVWNRP